MQARSVKERAGIVADASKNNEFTHAAPAANPQELRSEIDRAIGAGEAGLASSLLQRLWRQHPDPATAGFVVGRYEKLRGKISLQACRLAILRSFTVEPIVPLLRASAFAGGIDLTVHVGEFNAYAQEMLNPGDRLHEFQPGVVILAVQARDIVPELWTRFTDLPPEAVKASIARCVDEFRNWVRAFRAVSPAQLVIHTLEVPSRPVQGVFDAQAEHGQTEAIRAINRELLALARSQTDVYLLDYTALLARHGAESWSDERKWLTVRLPIASNHMIHMAREWMRFIHPLTGKVCKAVVLDLDNTLWGGVIGEDGMSGIKLDGEFPGAAYQNLQRVVVDLYNRGVIVAVNSKNNLADAKEAIENHRGMILRPEHIAAMRCNWQDKATNLREIAAELNIGVDSLCFVDDNPVERQWVRDNVPEVTVLELPADPMQYAATLRDAPVFERLVLSAEDKSRGRYYAEERLRTEFEQAAPNLDEFLWSLKMEAEIGAVDAETLARVSQLTNKTNQFNLTTRRYTEQQVKDMAADPSVGVYWLRLRDRFGDNGIIGVGISRLVGDAVEIDTFLLSCRVIGRGIEGGFLGHIAARAKARGARKVWGWYLPTKKNAPCKEFYASLRFDPAETTEAGGIRYEFDLGAGEIPWPACVALKA